MMQHALEAPEQDDFAPPEYQGIEFELEPGFHKHEADFLNLIEGIPVKRILFARNIAGERFST